MMLLKMRPVVLTVVAMLFMVHSYGQIKVSEFLQESKIASADNNKLFFVDFWATWCRPCIVAKEQLGVLQKQFPSDLYVVSLTKESPLVVERFLERKPTGLAVAIDYKGETFDAYKVHLLPDGALFNAQGELLWQGGGADLKKETVAKFLRRENARTSLAHFFQIVSEVEYQDTDYKPTQAIEIQRLDVSKENLEINNTSTYLQLTGSLQDIVGYLFKINPKQIELANGVEGNYTVYFKKPMTSNELIASNFLTEMNLIMKKGNKEGLGILLEVDEPRFWDTEQINWGEGNTRFLVGDSQITADNVSLKEVAYQLSEAVGLPVVIPEDEVISLSLHDWDFHYKFFQLMQSDFKDNYGIIAQKKNVIYPVYQLQKKAP